MIDIESFRAGFEATMLSSWGRDRADLKRRPDGQYDWQPARDAFLGWCAAKADTVVVTEEMVAAGLRAWQSHPAPTPDDAGFYTSEKLDEAARETVRAVLTAALNGEGKA